MIMKGMNLQQKLNLMQVEFNSRTIVSTKVPPLVSNVSRVNKITARAVTPPLPPDNFCKTRTDIIKTGYNCALDSSLCMINSQLYTDFNSKPYLNVANIIFIGSVSPKSIIYI